MALELQILGSNSAAFAHNRHHTAQILRVQDKYFLIDCGEGTQLLLKRYKIKLARIQNILISHLHGDHYYGLMGLLSTLHLYGKKADVHIYGPPGLLEIISLQLRYSSTFLSYDIKFHEWTPNTRETIFEDSQLTIDTIPLDHRIPCSGFLFREKPKKRGLLRDKIPELLTPLEVNDLKLGKDLFDKDGNIRYRAKEVTIPPKKPYSYAYCSDTRLVPGIEELIGEVDLVYHESTFMEDMKERANYTYHTTAAQAAALAKRAKVGKLLLGHFSTRYKDLSPMLREAKNIFANTELAEEGRRFLINH
ncbi:MAG: ribonuclease Z [Bacteroidota bacterium]